MKSQQVDLFWAVFSNLEPPCVVLSAAAAAAAGTYAPVG